MQRPPPAVPGRVLSLLVLLLAWAVPAQAAELTVAAAANLRHVLEELVTALRAERPGIVVQVSYGASGNFHAQLTQGAPYDVFLSADTLYPQRLAEAGLALDDGPFVYATGRLALWVPAGSPLPVAQQGLAVLADPSVRRIAIANPRHAPYGAAAVAALEAAGLYESTASRLVSGENVSQAAQFVASGAAQAGFVALSLALSPPLSGGSHYLLPADSHPPLEQGGVILRRARDPAAARALRDFLRSERGRAILGRYGYDTQWTGRPSG